MPSTGITVRMCVSCLNQVRLWSPQISFGGERIMDTLSAAVRFAQFPCPTGSAICSGTRTGHAPLARGCHGLVPWSFTLAAMVDFHLPLAQGLQVMKDRHVGPVKCNASFGGFREAEPQPLETSRGQSSPRCQVKRG